MYSDRGREEHVLVDHSLVIVGLLSAVRTNAQLRLHANCIKICHVQRTIECTSICLWQDAALLNKFLQCLFFFCIGTFGCGADFDLRPNDPLGVVRCTGKTSRDFDTLFFSLFFFSRRLRPNDCKLASRKTIKYEIGN